MKEKMIKAIMMLAMMAGAASAAEVVVSENISTATRWKAENVYNLDGQIYVLPGASLTIEPGTLIQSTAGEGGSLAICKGGMIFVNGTAEAPVIFTSSNDDFSTWRPVCREWGNLTIMGDAVIGRTGGTGRIDGMYADADPSIDGVQAPMEGLTVEEGMESSWVTFGGLNDADDSGSISYVSLRYGGKVVSLANELNGLSLGGIGSETDIHHVEIMNNVDDGIEIWGGTINLSYVSIWNIGDDSFDCDQGWRGNAQFGLIVQGYSAAAKQGSGVGDNVFEIDGAEDSDATPLSDATIANFTVVGQPVTGGLGGDHATAWRDNANVQYYNCIFTDIGGSLLKNDGDDGDGASGYGHNGTATWAQRWANGSCLMKGSVFHNVASMGDSTALTYVNATSAQNQTVTTSPLKSVVRGPQVVVGSENHVMKPVTFIDPRLADGFSKTPVAIDAAQANDFFQTVSFVGGFSANDNWLAGWSAASQYGMTTSGMTSTTEGDLTGDGHVDMADFAELAENWGL